MSDCLIVIPARYKSARLPGKPLRKIGPETMIKRVYRICTMTGLDTIVATDNNKIAQECINNSMEFVMTSPDCLTGTDRVADAASIKTKEYAGYINVQGDEPFVNPDDILKIAEEMTPRAFDRKTDEVFCGMCRITEVEQYYSPHVPKIVFNQDKPNSGLLRYASRAPIPAMKKGYHWPEGNAWKQVCIYGFKWWHLKEFTKQKEKTTLEFVEDIEILRFLEMGITVRMIMIEGSPMSVDTEEDLQKANDLVMKLNPNLWN